MPTELDNYTNVIQYSYYNSFRDYLLLIMNGPKIVPIGTSWTVLIRPFYRISKNINKDLKECPLFVCLMKKSIVANWWA